MQICIGHNFLSKIQFWECEMSGTLGTRGTVATVHCLREEQELQDIVGTQIYTGF